MEFEEERDNNLRIDRSRKRMFVQFNALIETMCDQRHKIMSNWQKLANNTAIHTIGVAEIKENVKNNSTLPYMVSVLSMHVWYDVLTYRCEVNCASP